MNLRYRFAPGVLQRCASRQRSARAAARTRHSRSIGLLAVLCAGAVVLLAWGGWL